VTARVNEETGSLDVGKDRTGERALDHGEGIGADDTRMGEAAGKRLLVGKHGALAV